MPERLRSVALGLLVLWGGGLAHAQDTGSVDETGSADERPTQDPPDASAPEEEITVWGDLEVARKLHALDGDLRGQGYRAGERKDGRTVYHPRQNWKPTVVVHDEGFVTLKRTPVQLGLPPEVSPWWYLACPIAPTMCVRVGGQVVSKRKLDAQKGRVLAHSYSHVGAWRTAVVDRAMQHYILDELPTRLDGAWQRGEPLEAGGPALATQQQRRDAILTLWSSRACTPEGDQVAEAVALFISEELLGAGLLQSEIDAANQRASCGRYLDLRVVDGGG